MLQRRTIGLLEDLKADFPCGQFIITGSIALSLHGLIPVKEDYDDIDIIMVDVPTTTIEKLDLLSRVHKSQKNPSIYNTPNMYRFTYKGVDVDVWIEPKRNNLLMYNGFWVSGVKEIIDAKKRFGRAKDYIQINDIVVDLLTPLGRINPIDSKEIELCLLPNQDA